MVIFFHNDTSCRMAQLSKIIHLSLIFSGVNEDCVLNLWLTSETVKDKGKFAVWPKGDSYMGNSL